MAKNLLIVESPAKAKTIEKYLGGDFMVMSSYGHIRDLPKKGLSIDKDNDFEPTYEIPEEKKKAVASLKKAAKTAKEVWLASDEDREGEAIAWHLCEALGLDRKKTKRIVFHEITKPAIERAVQQPREVDKKLVDAQQARRVLDRLVGYELSPVLWKKVSAGLSAGRVQSVAVKLIVEKEREIEDFKSTSKFKILATFKHAKGEIHSEAIRPAESYDEAKKLIEQLIPGEFSIESIIQKDARRNPSPPFTTSSLQQEASVKLGFSVRQTMTLAQRLYEDGHITYMRTDSTNMSSLALDSAQSYIKSNFGENYSRVTNYATKNRTAQEAHEAIRPSSFDKNIAGSDEQQKKLYQLIWKRAIASQMAQAQIKRTEIRIGGPEPIFVAKGEILVFDGYQKIYGQSKDDVILPDANEGDKVNLLSINGVESFSRPPARYSEAALVKKLEELGIGRPSTYAPTISTIQSRGYVEKNDSEGQKRKLRNISWENGTIKEFETEENTGVERGKLIPTYLAEMTTDFLSKYFAMILDYKFTARVEEDFDEIARGEQTWHKMIKDFYASFHPLVEKSADVSRKETSKARVIGTDESSGKPIIARYGKYGPMLQKGEVEDEEKPDFAPLPQGTTIENVTLAQAKEAFKLPRIVGKLEDGQEVSANVGRFGPYIKVGSLFVSIKGKDPMKITLGEAKELYLEKLKKDEDKYIQKFSSGINVINGPYGPYITDGKRNAKIPDDIDPKKIEETKAKEILESAPARKKRFARKKKT